MLMECQLLKQIMIHIEGLFETLMQANRLFFIYKVEAEQILQDRREQRLRNVRRERRNCDGSDQSEPRVRVNDRKSRPSSKGKKTAF